MAGWESLDDTSLLGEADLRDVISAVTNLAGRWKDLGISLGMCAGDLDTILSANPHSPSNCLREMLLQWLRQSYNVEKFGKPTRKRLVEAVKNNAGGNNPALAQTIARDHPSEPDKRFRKLENQQQFSLHLDERQDVTDSTNIFSLPQYIRVRVSNYQLLQTIFAVPEDECPRQEINADEHRQQIKKEEQFSPTVTVVDTATQQPLDCVLLLHGEKPPEVSCRTLFCYIAVQVTDVPHCDDEHGSYPYPLYHMESKPCKHAKLPLIFCFHQPGTVCVIQLSIHSIVNSEGVEYMHHSEDFTCIVQIIDRVQHGGGNMRDRHGLGRIKEPPLLTYTGPLATKQYHKIARCFETLYSPYNYEQIKKLANKIIDGRHIKVDLKAYALCWAASNEICLHGSIEDGEKLLRSAWKKASTLECENGLLLQAMIHRRFAAMYCSKGKYDKALEHISEATIRLCHAAHSRETALVLYRNTMVEWRQLVAQRDITTEKCKSIEAGFDKLLEHISCVEEYERSCIFMFHMEKAKFHLRTLLISDKCSLEKYRPSQDDLRKAEECLKQISLDMLPSEDNFYVVRYYEACCDLCLWRGQYSEAIGHLKKAKHFYAHENSETNSTRRFNDRFKLLEELKTNAQKANEQKVKEEEEIEEILKEFSDF